MINKESSDRVTNVAKGPLTGVRILSVEQYIAGPYCSLLLADAGAEVIKIERPPQGDPRRNIGPMVFDEEGQEISGGFWEYNRSKKSITLNIQKDEGKVIFLELLKSTDVLLVNLRPGSMDRLGLGYEDLKKKYPRLVYASITGFGEFPGYRGPYWQRPAFDIVAEAMSGVMEMVGFPDRPPHFTLFGMPDIVTAIYTAYGIMVALFHREMSGEGQFVESPMYDSMLALNERAVMQYSLTGIVPTRGAENLQGPRGAFRAKDGYIAFNIPTDAIWRRFTSLIKREDLIEDSRTKTGPLRAASLEGFLRPIIQDWLKDKSREGAVRLLIEAGVPAGPVQNMIDVFRCPQIADRKMLVDVPSETEKMSRPLARSPVLFSSCSEIGVFSPPTLGKHTKEVLLSLGYDEKTISGFKEEKII